MSVFPLLLIKVKSQTKFLAKNLGCEYSLNAIGLRSGIKKASSLKGALLCLAAGFALQTLQQCCLAI